MNQLTLDSQLSKSLKTQGLDAVETSNLSFVELMRREAIRLSNERGWLTSDDLRVYASRLGIAPDHPNAWGSVLRGPHWKVIGHRKSAVPSSHHREIKIWQYQPWKV